ncbi:MAG: arginyltransferase [Parvularculaceae bacterium]|nr:arginyltransferase [Parvularculaceae bacterium]
MRNEDVTRKLGLEGGEYYITAPSPCPYLDGQVERKVFAYLGGPQAPTLNSMLSRRGFRRSQNIIYRPACDACQACTPVRIIVSEFDLDRARRRIMRKNADLARTIRPPKATSEQFSILRGYLDRRHPDGGMAEMTVLDFASMVEETAVDTAILEYRRRDAKVAGGLIAAALSDRLADGLSMVYSFFEPDEEQRSLGAYMILDHIALARDLGLPFVYLGYWVDGSPKMHYKRSYQPLEHLTPNGWARMSPA